MNKIFKIFDLKITFLTIIFALLLLLVTRHGYSENRNYNIIVFIITFVIYLFCLITLKFQLQLKIIKFLKGLIIKKKFLIPFSILFFVFFVLLAYKRHLNLETAILDLSLEQQVLWNTAQGRWFQSGIETANYLGDHFSLITLPIALVYKIFPHVLTMFVLQTAAVVIAAWGVQKLAFLFLKNQFKSALFMLSFLFYTGISGLLLFDYHPNVYALPLLIWGIFYYHKKQIRLSFLLLTLAALCKEEIAVFVAMFGLLIALKYKDKRGWLILILGILYSLLALFVFIPYFRNETADTLQRYSWLGSTPLDIIKTIITNPVYVIENLFGWVRISYLLKLALPVLFLFILAVPETLIILPSLFINLFTDYPAQVSAMYQYDITITVGLFYASIIGLGNFVKKFRTQTILLVFFMVNFSLLFTHPFVKTLIKPIARYQDYLYLQELQQIIPQDFVVSASNLPGGQFGHFENLQLFDPGVFVYQVDPDIVIVDKIVGYDESVITKITSLKDKGYTIYQENNSLLILLKSGR